MNKRIILLAVVLMSVISLVAQTNFRELSFDAAVAAAKTEKKLLFIDFYTDWCGPCKRMSKEVFPLTTVGEYMNKNFVCIKLNAEKEGKELAGRFQVKAYPTYVVLNDKEEVVFDAKGMMQGDAFLLTMEQGMDPEKNPARLAERYQKGERSPELVNMYALNLMEEGKEGEGFKVVDSYFNSLSDKDKLDSKNSFLFFRYTMNLDDPKGQYVLAHRNEFEPVLQEKIVALLARLYRAKVLSYFSGYMFEEGRYDNNAYQTLKKEVLDTNIDKSYDYKPLFALIDSYAKGNIAQYLSDCETNFGQLSQMDKGILLMNMSRLVKEKDPVIKKSVAKLIRTHLSELSSNSIMLCGRTLEAFEKED